MNMTQALSVRSLLAFALLMAVCGCGDGSGGIDAQNVNQSGRALTHDADDDVDIYGTVRTQTDALEDVTVCALGDCDTTNGAGEYHLTVPAELFTGGDVLFTFDWDRNTSETVVRNLPAEDVAVNFELRENGIVPVSVTPEPFRDNDEDGVRDDDEDEDDDVDIRGTVRSPVSGGIEDIEVCALGDCAATDGAGEYALEVPKSVWAGGDVLFSFEGNGVNSQAVVRNIPGEDVNVNFELRGRDVVPVAVIPESREADDDDDDVFDEIEDEINDIDDDIDEEIDEIEDGIDDDDDRVEISGTLRSRGSVEDVRVCALGSCGTTDEDGDYRFTIPRGVFSGGDVLFTFQGAGLNTSAVAPGVPGNRDADVDFVATGNTVQTSSVSGT